MLVQQDPSSVSCGEWCADLSTEDVGGEGKTSQVLKTHCEWNYHISTELCGNTPQRNQKGKNTGSKILPLFYLKIKSLLWLEILELQLGLLKFVPVGIICWVIQGDNNLCTSSDTPIPKSSFTQRLMEKRGWGGGWHKTKEK